MVFVRSEICFSYIVGHVVSSMSSLRRLRYPVDGSGGCLTKLLVCLISSGVFSKRR